jgi:predicted DNA-binding protein
MDKVTYQLSVKLTEEDRVNLEKICEIERRPKSWVVRDILQQYMKKYLEDKS